MKINVATVILVQYFFFIATCFVFFFGFFPLNLAPSSITGVEEQTYAPNAVNRSIFMIIDALRYDFVAKMPHLSRKILEGSACKVKIKVHPPTVTMPRLKTIISGTVSSFIDVILNLGSPEMTTDNLLLQLRRHGRRIVFYGDNVWVKLFNETIFHRAGPNIDAFFVNDFYEGDKNITKNVFLELQRNDWDFMLLHFLGLDHIGHVLGAKNDLISEKLLEMDQLIEKMGSNVPIFITGDHGMRDAGGHGGSSKSETEVPFIAVGLNECISSEASYDQVDLATTLALLLNISIPSSSVGTLVPEFVPFVGVHEYVTHRLLNLVKNLKSDWKLQEFFIEYSEAKQLGNTKMARIKFESSSQKMRSLLVENSVKYNMESIYLGIVTSFLVLASVIVVATSHTAVGIKLTTFVATTIFSLVIGMMAQISSSENFILIWIGGISIVTIVNHFKKDNFMKYMKIIWNQPKTLKLLYGLLIFRAISFASSSFVEEEHQTWYFTCYTLFFLICLQDIRKHGVDFQWIFFFLLHLILRRLNQTGDKWINEPDIGDFLTSAGNEKLLQLTFLFGLVLVYSSLLSFATRTREKLLLIVVLALVFLYKVSSLKVFLYAYWTILTILPFTLSKVHRVTILIILIATLLQKPHNVVLNGANILTCKFIDSKLKTPKIFLVLLHLSIGNMFFFYQGNSNSLATIDLNAGYVGLESFSFVLVGIFLTINTYTGQLLSYLMLTSQLRRNSTELIIKVISLAVMAPISLYLIIVTAFRYHLFIWTVFSPNIFYKFYFLVLNFVVLLLTRIVRH